MIPVSSLSLAAADEREAPLAVFAHPGGALAGAGALAPALRKELWRLAEAEGLRGEGGECVLVWAARGGRSRRFLIAGAGRREEAGAEAWRRAAAVVCQNARARFEEIAVLPGPDARATAEGLMLGSYRFTEYRKAEAARLARASLVFAGPAQRRAVEKACAEAAVHADAVALVRDLVDRAPSDKTPESIAALAQTFAGKETTVTVISKAEADKLGMGSFLGVARAGGSAPVFLHLCYKPKGARRKVGLVGKGITFDSGGLSLKPPASMETMKCDMAGAAAVLGVFKALPQLKIKAEVHGFCPFTYNLPGPDAVRPGDILRAMNGKTIEVLNTDAEGRLVLADALVYACRQKLDAIIDLATLTGAAVVALGSKISGAMTNNRALLAAVQAAARRAGETLCELPLHREYRDHLKSSFADLKNIGKPGEAGTIIGGLFLAEFVDETPWLHLDIAGTSWTDADTPLCPRGGTGAMVPTLLEYLRSL